MRRRELILSMGCALTAARSLRAQQKLMPVIGFLSSVSPDPIAPYMAAFHQGLKEAGYADGQNVAIEYRWAEGHYDRLPAMAADLVGRKVDVIATAGGTSSAFACEACDFDDPNRFLRYRRPSRGGPGRQSQSTGR